MTRLLSYTNFFDITAVAKPTYNELIGTEFLDYDNIPDFTEVNKELCEQFLKDPRKISFTTNK